MVRKLIILLVFLVLAAVFLLYPRQVEQPRVSISVSGAWALYPMVVRWGEEYQKSHPNVKVDISAGGAGKGMADALNGLVDIGMVSREIDASEVEKGAFGISVVKDAVLPTANRESPFADRLASHGLTKTLFKELFVSGSLTDWNQVFGLSGSGGKINVYVRSDSCGAGEVWGKYLGVKQEDLNGIGIYGDPGIAEAVSRDADGVGFNNLNYAFDSNTTLPVGNLMIIPIDLNEDGVIDDGESFYSNSREVMQAIADGRYPSPPARELYLVTKGKPSGQVKDFIQWILADGQQYVVESGYIALKPDSLSEQVNKVS